MSLIQFVAAYQLVSIHSVAALTCGASGYCQPAGNASGSARAAPTPAAAATAAIAQRTRPGMRRRRRGTAGPPEPAPPRPAPRTRVMRSSTTAMITMAMPPSNSAPVLVRDSALMIFSPRPGASISAVITTIEIAIMIVWLTASRMVERAIGSRTLIRVCHQVAPIDRDASIAVGETWRMPSAAIRIAGGIE